MLKNKYLLITLIAIPIIWAITLIASYSWVKSQIYNKYFVDFPNRWSPFYKQTYLSFGISGKLNVSNEGWKITSGKKEYSLLKTASISAILGNKFSGDDTQNWQDLATDNLQTNDQVIVNAFYLGSKASFIPNFIFVQKR